MPEEAEGTPQGQEPHIEHPSADTLMNPHNYPTEHVESQIDTIGDDRPVNNTDIGNMSSEQPILPIIQQAINARDEAIKKQGNPEAAKIGFDSNTKLSSSHEYSSPLPQDANVGDLIGNPLSIGDLKPVSTPDFGIMTAEQGQPEQPEQPTTPDAVVEVSPNDVKRSGDVFFPGELSASAYREKQKEELIKKYGPIVAAQMMREQPLPDHMADLAANVAKPQTIGEIIAGAQPPAAESMSPEDMTKWTTDHTVRTYQLHEDMSKMEPFKFFDDVQIQAIVRETTEDITPAIQEALQKNIKTVLEQNLQARDKSFQNTLQIPKSETTPAVQPVSDLLHDPKSPIENHMPIEAPKSEINENKIDLPDASSGTPPAPTI